MGLSAGAIAYHKAKINHAITMMIKLNRTGSRFSSAVEELQRSKERSESVLGMQEEVDF